MLNIVVYGENNTFMTNCVCCVKASLFGCGVKYQINRYTKYDESMDEIIQNGEKKIYILDRDSSVSGLEIAKIIRKNDCNSVIIIVSKDKNILFYNSVLDLDFKFIGMIANDMLVDYENNALEEQQKVLTFKYNRVVYRIPFNDITYIEKESNVKRCIIHTDNHQYYITNSLGSILKLLDDNFYRTHQSCIINLNNIKKMELGSNTVIFKNDDKTDMVTCKTKREIKKHIGIS